MAKRLVKYLVLLIVIGLFGYNSVYFKKLDAKTMEQTAETNLSPVEIAQKFWTKQFHSYLDSAVEINGFLKMLKENPKQTFEKYSQSQGIGNTSFFLVKGDGVITNISDDDVTVAAKSNNDVTTIKLNTGIYFGNAVRDVTGKISMGDFSNTMDFNTVSSELNKIVHTQIVTPFKIKAVKGAAIQFVGCVEINQEQINTDNMQVLPVKIIVK